MLQIHKKYILLSVLFLAIVPYCFLCFYANPSADDFSMSAQAQQNDLLELLSYSYQARNGRYLSSVICYINPLVYNSFLGYKFFSVFLIIFLLLSIYRFMTELLYPLKMSYKLLASLVFLMLYFHNMPIISEGIYWYTGGAIYTLGLGFSLLYFSLLIKTIRSEKGFVAQMGLIILLFVCCGFNEVLSLLMVSFLLLGAIISGQHFGSKNKTIYFQFLFALLFASLLLFAPGNAIRGNAYPEAKHFLHSLSYSILQVGRFTILWVLSIPLLVASFIFLQLNERFSEKCGLFRNSFYLNRWVSFSLLFVVTFICVFPAYWATGMLGQHRTLNVAYIFFLIIWFINLNVWGNHFRGVKRVQIKSLNVNFLWIMLIGGLVFTGNGYHTLGDLFSGKASDFNAQNVARFEKLYDAQKNGKEDLVLDPISVRPKTLFTYDITNNPKDWQNHAYNMYFRLDSVKIHLE